MKKVRIGLAGVGWMGSEHARNILANSRAELAAVVDVKSEVLQAFKKKHAADCKTFTNFTDMLSAGIDAVVIASPNKMHADMCVEAAKHKKHIYCEKPMAITPEDCKRVREAVEKAKVKYLIGYHRRLNPLVRYAKGLLDKGALGKAFMAESDYLHHVPGDLDIWSWLGRKGIAGSIFHAGSGHNVDLLRHFLGDISEVACFKGAFLPRVKQVETEDTASAIFKFKNNTIGKVQCCVGPILPFTFTLKLYGTKGSIINNRVHMDPTDSITLPERWIPDNVQGSISEPWNKLMDHFIDMLADNAKCINDVRSAYKTSIACFAAVEAAEKGTVVETRRME